MMTQPIQMFENLTSRCETATSETAPAGGNVAKTAFNHDDRGVLEVRARYARSMMLANVVTDAILWVGRRYKRVATALKDDFKLRAAEAQLFRMSDRELSDLGLCRADIPFAIREAAVDGVTPQFDAQAGTHVAANQNVSHPLYGAGRA